MFKEDNFIKSYKFNLKKYYENLKKTKKIFNLLLLDLKKNQLPLFKTLQKDYEYSFSTHTKKKFLKYENIVIIGMGGSVLGAKSIYSFFKKKIKKNIIFFDNLDPNLYFKYKKLKNKKNTCFIIISKSGNTLETITNVNNILPKKLLKNRLVIITELKNNSLLKIGNKFNAEIIEHNKFIGGRFSVFSEVGMFPASLMKLNIFKFKSLKKLLSSRNFTDSLIKSVSSIYTFYQSQVKNSVILNYDTDLSDLSSWHQQLVGESLGKQHKGINPSISVCPKDHHSLLQLYLDGPRDKFFTFFTTSTANNKNIIVTKSCNNNNLYLYPQYQ